MAKLAYTATDEKIAPALRRSMNNSTKEKSKTWIKRGWLPLLIVLVVVLIYAPSLKSDFVYDARFEILSEGFVTSLSNLPAVLSLKVLGMNIVLGDRPGQILFLMLNAALWGKDPWGYHLSSILIHAVNAVLLFVLMRRLLETELSSGTKESAGKAQFAIAVIVLVFALHPVAVESVAAVSYSSDLLVTFFTLLTLIGATAFRPGNTGNSLMRGSLVALSCLAAVSCKESGIAAPLLLIVYWLLFRRAEKKWPWVCLSGAAITLVLIFTAARFILAPANQETVPYLGGSLNQVFLIQPRLWVFMMGKLIWPTHLSADYTQGNVSFVSLPMALGVLCVVVGLQVALACKSRLGALGVATYWLGLLSVSNFIPLYRPLADRFYYLPLVGVSLQLLALLVIAMKSEWGYRIAIAGLILALTPLAALTITRQAVFANELSLWKATLEVSPLSLAAHFNLGNELARQGRFDEAITQYQKALEIDPANAKARNNLVAAFIQCGRINEAIPRLQRAVELNPHNIEARYRLGNIFAQNGRIDDAILQFQQMVEFNPKSAEGHYNLGNALAQKGRLDEAIAEYQKTLEINPGLAKACNNLGSAYFERGQFTEATVEFQKAVLLDPTNENAQKNLSEARAKTFQQKTSRK